MMAMWYGLDGQPIDAASAERLLADDLARRIAHTTIVTTKGTVTVSTVFLVLNHSFGEGPPVLWESMAFGGPLDEDQRRYASREAAVAGHAEMVTIAKAACEVEGAEIITEDEFRPQREDAAVAADRVTDIAGLIERYGVADAGPIRVRFPLEVGALVAGQFSDAVAYGKSLGLAIDAHRGGGVLIHRYQVVAAGPWADLRRFLEFIVALGSEAS